MMSTGAFTWCLSYHWSQVESMMLSDWNHTFFINCSASMFSANMQLEPSLVKEVTNHNQNPSQTLAQPLHGIAKPRKKVHLSTTGNLNRVNTRWKARFAPGIANGGGWGVQMTGTLHHANLSFFLWIIFPTCFRWSVLWKLFHFTTTYCCISVWNEQKMV